MAGYLKSASGIVKILRLVFSLLACGCFIFGSRNGMYIGVTGLEFFFTLCSMLIYLTGLDKKITFFYWILIDLLNTMLTTVFLFIVSIIAIISKMNLATTVGGAFGLTVVALCYLDMCLLGKVMKKKQPSSSRNQSPQSE
uniref:Chemokine-like factor isoform X2 n=1 Tax=Geotrypetes seraphini TaxID=260995 RepID=A0A6P8REJ2_GEOSA|nr:chemokine-like factor isoform X2 [Geotrypetes seraphini]